MNYARITPYFREQLGLPEGVFVCDLPAGTQVVSVTRSNTSFLAVHPDHPAFLIHPWGPEPLRPGQIIPVERLPL